VKSNPKQLLALSGGVDSAVAASLLLEAGEENQLSAAFLRHNIPCHKDGLKLLDAAEADARRIADILSLPLQVINAESSFGKLVDYFVTSHLQGETPNPCAWCNPRVKFQELFTLAEDLGVEQVATGHYVRTGLHKGEPVLLRGIEQSKDQSYMLFDLPREWLPKLRFPVGAMDKKRVRQIATEKGLPVAAKKDSQEICFIPDNDHAAFIERATDGDYSGDIVTTDGTVVGQHTGYFRFTIGQRKGLGVALGEPHYVVAIRPQSREVVLGRVEELEVSEVFARDANWHVLPSTEVFHCTAKVRYNSPPVKAEVTLGTNDTFQVQLEDSRQGVAPGQAVVLYDGEVLLGGGWIEGNEGEKTAAGA